MRSQWKRNYLTWQWFSMVSTCRRRSTVTITAMASTVNMDVTATAVAILTASMATMGIMDHTEITVTAIMVTKTITL